MKYPRIIARYLPQFHQIPENDEWWGKGFTEWTAVRGARPLFPGHRQPQSPLGGNYYNLLEKETMLRQASLAGEYGIDGFAFYHYWFENGKKILEKPTENLLGWRDIDVPFCFCWANQTWARTWSKFWNANSWNSVCEANRQDKGSEILLKQRYGLTGEWEKHIEYLLPFFLDDRYIKQDNRPVFIVLEPDDPLLCLCMKDMFSLWNERLARAGLGKLFMIAEKKGMKTMGLPAYELEMLRFPDVLFSQVSASKREGVKTFCYEDYVKKLEEVAIAAMSRGDLVCVADAWDNTPRYGTEGSVILQNGDCLFGQWWPKIVAEATREKLPFIFYNAWNEWGEGMFLEPSEEKGHYYLEVIKGARVRADDAVMQESALSKENLGFPKIEHEQRYPSGLVEKWMNLRDERRSIADYLERSGVHKVAIYGIGMFGRHLTRELLGSDIEIACLIDKNKSKESYGLPLYESGSQCPEVDLLIVTPFGFYEEIRQELKGSCSWPTCSLEYIIDDMLLELQM